MALLKALIQASDSLVDFKTYFEGSNQKESSVHALEIHKEEIVRLWSEFKSAYDDVLDKFEKIKGDLSMESIKTRYYSSFDVYLNLLASVNELLDGVSQKSTTTVEADQVPHISLPPCDTEVFYGDYKSWPTFRDMFTALYVNNKRLSPVEKMCHLLKKTQGEARDLLKTCPITNDGFDMGWKNLINRYENKRVLVNAQLKCLFNISPISKETGSNIRRLQRTVNDCVTNLSLLEIDTKGWDIIFVYICSTCLPDVTLSLWEHSLPHNTSVPTWKDMDAFLTSRFQTLESVADIRSTFSNPSVSHYNKTYSSKKSTLPDQKKLNSYSISLAQDNSKKCPLCPTAHPLRVCPVFIRMSITERYNITKQQKRCVNCLGTSHELKKCKSRFLCNICKKKHHTLLHRPESNSSLHPYNPTRTNTNSADSQPISDSTENSLNISDDIVNPTPSTSREAAARGVQSYPTQLQSTTNSVVLGTALVDVYHNDIKCTVRALIDSASEATFISKRLQMKLGLATRSSKTEIHGLSGSLTATATQVCVFQLGSPIESSFRIHSEAFVVKRLTGQLPYYSVLDLKNNTFQELHLADSHRQNCSEIDLLLGGDIYPQIIRDGLQWNNNQSLVAQKTVFGWIVTGKVNHHSHTSSLLTLFNKLSLSNQLQRFWELENIPKKITLTPEEDYCEKLYKNTTYKNCNGRFVVSLPFKQEYPNKLNVGSSRNIAISQFLRNEARLLKNPQLKTKYDQVITEYFTLGQMSKVTPLPTDEATYYMPHHAVLKPESTTTKLRVVFNASSPSSNGASLNDLLHPGPALQVDLTVLILRWRLFRYVFNADIEKMYRQILVSPSHTLYQRIIFRNTPHEQLQDYQLNTVTFGVNCAPYLAIRTLLELANECEPNYPKAADILRNFMYVDDVLAGAHTLSSAIEFRDQLIKVLDSAGFALRKWTSNNQYLLQDLPETYLLDEEFLKISDSSVTKTLGLRWNAGSDHFYFSLKTLPDRNMTTKRKVLSEIAKLFDPAGWLSPKIIVAKIIMQQIWKDGTEWDETLDPLTLQQWHTFLDDYGQIEQVKIPRFVDFNPEYSVELHGFCDASEKAYAATLYLRTEAQGFISTHLLLAKTKVAPVKFLSLPRKELCGAELMATMIDSIRSQLNLLNFKLYLWTDSTIVLAWLRKPPNSWNTFVEHRVSSITEKVGNGAWSHVDSKNNPADLATRGLTVPQLISSTLWWQGPPWLRQPQVEWPLETLNFVTDEEAKPVRVHATLIKNDDVLNDFSSLPKALRVICYVFRFYSRVSQKLRHTFGKQDALSTAELKYSKLRLVIGTQKTYFSTEYHQLSEGILLSRKSSLLTFNPFLDSEGVMRINGRLANSLSLSYDERYPIILPYHARYTRLFLSDLHKFSLHSQNALLYRLMRIHYYVPKLKTLIKTVISHCFICVKQKRQHSQQIMAALPQTRTSLTRPFHDTGVDFAGPFDMKSYAGRGCRVTKGYALIFVCFATKAIHLEATGEISTQAFLAAFARFFSRRGTPHTMYSDNGTAFVGASNILLADRKNFLSLVRKTVLDQNSFASIEWHFIPPGAPHMGGLWEAGVKSFKSHFKKVCHNQSFTYEEFSTLLTRIEACLNSRPLSPMSDDPSNLCALTPGHFLIGTPLLSPPEPDLTTHSLSYVNRWQKLKILHHNLARRWKEEYLIELHKRIKWKNSQRNYAVGDLVIIRQENLPPNQWRLGRIDQVHYGPDKRVRVADIRTANGLVTRPIVKLVLLPQPSQQ